MTGATSATSPAKSASARRGHRSKPVVFLYNAQALNTGVHRPIMPHIHLQLGNDLNDSSSPILRCVVDTAVLSVLAIIISLLPLLWGPLFKFLSSGPFSLFFGLTAVLKILQNSLFPSLGCWVQHRQLLTILASTSHPPNQCPCTLSPMQYLLQRRDASSVPLEDPDKRTDEAADCSGKCTQC